MGLISNGTTIFDNGSMASGFGGSLTFISKQTASASATVSITSGIDSSYKEYIIFLNNIHPQNEVFLEFNLSTDGGSNYNVTKTTTYFKASHREDDTLPVLDYRTGDDLAQSTAFQNLVSADSMSADNSDSLSGFLHLYNPSSDTFVKHFTAQTIFRSQATPAFCINSFIAGYGNTINPVDAIRFQMASGNIDSGEFLLFGLS